MRKITYNSNGEIISDEGSEYSGNNIYLHVSVTGGDGMSPPGIDVDSADKLSVDAVFRETGAPASPVIPVDTKFRIGIFHTSNGLARVIKVRFTAGVMKTLLLGSKGDSGYFCLREDDLTSKINGKGIKLAGDYEFKIFEDAS